MGFHRIDEAPDVRLAHFLGATTEAYLGGSTTTSRWALHPIVARRPAEGSARHRVYCGTCNRSVEVLVPSADRTRRTQRYWFALLVALLAVLVVVEGLLVVRAGRHGAGYGLGTLLVQVLVLVLFAGPSVAALDRAQHAHGVTVAPRQSREAVRHHSIRRPPVLGAKYRYRAGRAAGGPARTAAGTRPTRGTRHAPAARSTNGSGTGTTDPAATRPDGSHVTVGAVLGLRPGMTRDTVRARVGPSGVSATGTDALAEHPDAAGLPAAPDQELWRFDGPFPGYHTSLVFAADVVERVEIAPSTGTTPPDRADAGARPGRIRIDRDGIHTSTPHLTYQAVDASLGPMPRIDDNRWRSEFAELRTSWPHAAATTDPVLACIRRLLADLAADDGRPGHEGFLVVPMPDHACVHVVSIFDRAAAGTGVAYRVWRLHGGRWALVRSVPRP